ncbi:MAG: hypothetical protein K6D37_02075 [Prevotella sp.]|jgi:hypothetical protein|nr:hypothetical protein [Prevotella sp.]
MFRMFVIMAFAAVVTGMLFFIIRFVTGDWISVGYVLNVFGVFFVLGILFQIWLYWTEWRYNE